MQIIRKRPWKNPKMPKAQGEPVKVIKPEAAPEPELTFKGLEEVVADITPAQPITQPKEKIQTIIKEVPVHTSTTVDFPVKPWWIPAKMYNWVVDNTKITIKKEGEQNANGDHDLP